MRFHLLNCQSKKSLQLPKSINPTSIKKAKSAKKSNSKKSKKNKQFQVCYTSGWCCVVSDFPKKQQAKQWMTEMQGLKNEIAGLAGQLLEVKTLPPLA